MAGGDWLKGGCCVNLLERRVIVVLRAATGTGLQHERRRARPPCRHPGRIPCWCGPARCSELDRFLSVLSGVMGGRVGGICYLSTIQVMYISVRLGCSRPGAGWWAFGLRGSRLRSLGVDSLSMAKYKGYVDCGLWSTGASLGASRCLQIGIYSLLLRRVCTAAVAR